MSMQVGAVTVDGLTVAVVVALAGLAVWQFALDVWCALRERFELAGGRVVRRWYGPRRLVLAYGEPAYVQAVDFDAACDQPWVQAFPEAEEGATAYWYPLAALTPADSSPDLAGEVADWRPHR